MTDLPSQDSNQAAKEDLGQRSPPAGSTPSSFDLEYPEIPLHLSLDSLLAHSSSSSSSHSSLAKITMPPSEPNQRPLDGSWTSLIGDASSLEDDIQSENTDVESLLDVHSSDDIHSLEDGVTTDDAESTDEDLRDTLTEELDRGNILGPYVRHELPSPPSYPIIPQTPHLQLDDLDDTGSPTVRTYTTSRQLTETEVQSLPLSWKGFEPSKYFSVIRMPVLDDGLDLEPRNYFKVLLLGREVEQYREEIQTKLGDALVSRISTSSHSRPTSMTRFHLIPNALGPGAEPDLAELVAVDKVIDFDCYNLITSSEGPWHRSEFVLKNSRTGTEIVSKRYGSKFVVGNPRWTIPDFAIICVHLNDFHLERESCMMLSFVERHSIPHIVIRMDRGMRGNYMRCLTAASLHESIELRSTPPLVETASELPVDLAGFLNLDSSQLHRHIAYAVSAAETKSSLEVEEPPFEAVEKPATIFDTLPQLNMMMLKNIAMVLWVVGVYLYLGFKLWPAFSSLGPEPTSGSVLSNVSAEQLSTSTVHPAIEVVSTTSYASGQESLGARQVLDMTTSDFVTSLAADALHFQVGIAGDSQLLVKLPKVAWNRKKRSKLTVELTRKNQAVPAAVQELFDGVFSVQLLPHDAYGDIEVNLTMTKPELNQMLTVSFGDRYNFEVRHLQELWSMISGHAQEKLSSFSKTLGKIGSGLIPSHFQTLSGETKERLAKLSMWRPPPSRPMTLHDLKMAMLCHKIDRKMQTLQGRVVQQKEELAKRGKMLADFMSIGYSNTLSSLLGMAESANTLFARLRPDKPMIVDRLEIARGRAHGIVSKAARNLRARNEGA
ncbi:hypothetical protein H2200_012725 [Cladophialophora chaetospira]|uniref:Uncharacterized protein n=1 Tax=Cladophialophora chaetospira TaxID=386627 RepID=A0AA39CC98_9EURO|nr:hypothetical protein H2200_012725 [Cladophialophora chaetospira]